MAAGGVREQKRGPGQKQAASSRADQAPESVKKGAAAQREALGAQGSSAAQLQDGGAGAEAAAQEGPIRETVLDLSSMLNPHSMAEVLRSVADETGEVGQIKFSFEALGKVGNPALRGRLGGLLDMKMLVQLNDQNYYNVQMDYEGALHAGFEIGGVFHIDAEAGFGTDFVNMSFGTPVEAATYLLHQLNKINDLTDEPLLDIQGIGEEAPTAQFSMHDKDVFIGAELGAEFGDFEGEASVKRLHRQTSLQTAEGLHYHVERDQTTFAAALEAEIAGREVELSYTREDSNTVGSPVYYNNGGFSLHNLNFTVPLMDFSRGGSVAVTKNTQSMVMGAFMALEVSAMGFPHVQQLNSRVFNQIARAVRQMEALKAKLHGSAAANFGVRLRFQWHEYAENSGENNLMYFRVFVEPHMGTKFEVEANAGVGGLELSRDMEISKSELLYESIGANTVSYIQRQFIYQNDEQPWERFVAANAPQIRQLVENCADPDFNYHVPEVSRAFGGSDGQQRDHDAGLRALERHWTQMHGRLSDIKLEANEIGEHLEEASSMWTLRQSTRERHIDAILGVMGRFESDPNMMAFLVDQLGAYGVDMLELERLAIRTDRIARLRRFFAVAAQGGARTRLRGLRRVSTRRGTRWK